MLSTASPDLLRPTLGWNTWPTIGCALDCTRWPDHCLSERVVKQMIDGVVAGGWRAAGYSYISVDDCAFTGRDARGELIADPTRFTNGTLAALADVRRRRVRGLEQAPFLLSSREIVAADTVCLRDRALSDTAVTAFADACVAGACHTATNVLLSGNEVGDQGCTALAACLGRGALSNVTYLSLFKNRIGDAGAAALGRALGGGALPGLIVLLLNSNAI